VRVRRSGPFSADAQLPVFERLQKHGHTLAAKLEQRRQEFAEKELEGATFKPEVRRSALRGISGFLCPKQVGLPCAPATPLLDVGHQTVLSCAV
jgi:hypothetical protein